MIRFPLIDGEITKEEQKLINDIKGGAEQIANLYDAVDNRPAKSLALDYLQESVFLIIKTIVG